MVDSKWQQFFPPTVEVKRTEELGRGLYAREEIPRGTEILRSDPFAYVVNSKNIEDYCSFCLKPRKVYQREKGCYEIIPTVLKKCSKCMFVWYCGKECQTKDWYLHKLECKQLVEIRAVPEYRNLRSYEAAVEDNIRMLIRLQRKNEESKSFETLPDNARQEMDLLQDSGSQSQDPYTDFIAQYAIKHFRMGSHSKEELLQLLYKLKANSHGIRNQQCGELGLGIYTGPSLLNHSCDPNCYRVYEGRTFILRAVKAIQPGEQLFITYTHLMATYRQRQAKLWGYFHFHCQCYRCVSECQKDSPYHVMYAAIGKVSEEKKEAIMEEGSSAIEMMDKLDDHEAIVRICHQLLAKYKGVLHPGNVINTEILDRMSTAYARLGDTPKIFEGLERLCQAYQYCPFKDHSYHYGMDLLDLGVTQLNTGKLDQARKTLAEAIDVFSLAVGPHHHLTVRARHVQGIVNSRLQLRML